MKNKFLLAVLAFTMPLAGCSFQDLMFWKAKENEPVHTHSYGTPVFDWSNFNLENNVGKVYALFSCDGCDSKIIKEAKLTFEQNEDCASEQYIKYTASYESAEFGGPYIDKKEIKSSTIKGHNLTKIDAVEATCQRNGNILFYYCNNCHKNFSDEDGKNEVLNVTIPKLDHQMTKYEARDKTCEQDGYIDHYHCSLCNLDYRDIEGNIPVTNAVIKKGHELIEHPANAPTCCEEGNKLYFECELCHKKFDSIEATNELIDVIVPRLGPTIQKCDEVPATCFDEGILEHYECTTCHKTYSDSEGNEPLINLAIPKKEHAWGKTTGECKWCNSINFMVNNLANRVTGTTVSIEKPSDMPTEFDYCYKATGDVGGGVGNNRYFKDSNIANYKQLTFAIKTFANPDNNEHLYLKTWTGDSEVLKSDNWVTVIASRSGTSNSFNVEMSNGRSYSIDGVSTLYGLLPLHHPNSLYSDFYITEVIGIQSLVHIHHFGTLVTGTPSTCLEEGIIDHYCCSECGKYFDKEFNPVDTLVEAKKEHNYVNNECTNCPCKIIPYSNELLTPENIAESTDYSIPEGYTKMYKYNAEAGGGYNNGCFFKHGTQLADFTSFKFSILTDRFSMFSIKSRTSSSSTESTRIPYQRYAGEVNPTGFVEVNFSRTSKSSNSWHITSTKPEGDTSGAAIDKTITISESGFVNSLWGVCTITNQNGGNWAPIYITEIVALG